jgi:hypothetical protein
MTIRASFKKKAPPILFGKNSRPADSFISENEGMNQACTPIPRAWPGREYRRSRLTSDRHGTAGFLCPGAWQGPDLRPGAGGGLAFQVSDGGAFKR